MSHDELPPLPEAWGSYDEWKFRAEDHGGITGLRMSDFPIAADARIFNEWAERDYHLQIGSKQHDSDAGS